MAKFKNFGLGIAGTTPDLTNVIANFGSSSARNILKSAQDFSASMDKIDKILKEQEAEQKKLRDEIKFNTERTTKASSDAQVDDITSKAAKNINDIYVGDKVKLTEEDAENVGDALNEIDMLKDWSIRTHDDPLIKQFDTDVAFENLSPKMLKMYKEFSAYNYTFNSDIRRDDPAGERRVLNFNDGNSINTERFDKFLVRRDVDRIRAVQRLASNYEDAKKNPSFLKDYYDTDLSATLQNGQHLGAQLITSKHIAGVFGGKTMYEHLKENKESFVDVLTSLGGDVDLNKDGTLDKDQADYIKNNYSEFLNALTFIDNDNYNENVSNQFAKNFILSTSELNHKNKLAENKLNEPGFTIENFFDNTTTTAATLGNITRLTQNLSIGDLAQASRYARQLGYVIRGIGNDGAIDDELRAGAPAYQIFERKVDMREEIDDGEGGKMQNPDLRRPKPGEAVSDKFTLNDQKALAKQFQILITEAQGYGFSRPDLNIFMKFLNRPGNENFIFGKPVMDFSFNENKNK